MTNKQLAEFQKDVESLLKNLKKSFSSEYKETDVTIGVSLEGGELSWSYQTGDNSFTGGAYGHPYWTVLYLHRRSSCKELAKEASGQILELVR